MAVRAALLWLLPVLAFCLSARLSQAHGSEWDYIVIGTGPGGSTAARVLAVNQPSWEVLVLEAGEDRDEDEPIKDTKYAKTVTDEWWPQYMWQAKQLMNNVSMGDDQLTGGRLMGGSSSINAGQWVRPSKQWLERMYLASGRDPDWRPSQVLGVLQKLERLFDVPAGVDVSQRGSDGPVPVRFSPYPGQTSDGAATFVDAVVDVGLGSEIDDYNSPDSPIGAFRHWQVSQYPEGRRASASVTMLTKTVRNLPNLTLKTRTTAVRLLFELDPNLGKPKAVGVYVIENGTGKTLKAKKGIVVSAGHRSSLLLENSGIGDKDIIKSLLEAVGLPFIAHLPAVGENLGSDGTVLAALTHPANGSVSSDVHDLFAGGAFLPYPGVTPNLATMSPTGTWRFSEWYNLDPAPPEARRRRLHTSGSGSSSSGSSSSSSSSGSSSSGSGSHSSGSSGTTSNSTTPPLFIIGMIMLNTTSRGFAHIQSADPLYAPLASTKILQDDEDVERWVRLLTDQLKPIADHMAAHGYSLVLPAPALFEADRRYARQRRQLHSSGGGLASGAESTTLEDFVADTYTHTHHWFGACRMGPSPEGSVVDSHGAVWGVGHLFVADDSAVPIKPDGNTQVPAYMMGAMVANKIVSGA